MAVELSPRICSTLNIIVSSQTVHGLTTRPVARVGIGQTHGDGVLHCMSMLLTDYYHNVERRHHDLCMVVDFLKICKPKLTSITNSGKRNLAKEYLIHAVRIDECIIIRLWVDFQYSA